MIPVGSVANAALRRAASWRRSAGSRPPAAPCRAAAAAWSPGSPGGRRGGASPIPCGAHAEWVSACRWAVSRTRSWAVLAPVMRALKTRSTEPDAAAPPAVGGHASTAATGKVVASGAAQALRGPLRGTCPSSGQDSPVACDRQGVFSRLGGRRSARADVHSLLPASATNPGGLCDALQKRLGKTAEACSVVVL